MPIKCQICQREFKSIITGKHVKSHGITSEEYKRQFGPHSLATDEYRAGCSARNSGKNNPNFSNKMAKESKARISQANAGREAYNKGVPLSTETKEKLSQKAQARNKIWKESNSNPNTGSKRSEETKQKLKEKRALQVIKSESVQKAIQTKRDRGYDLGFFRGKRHSEETKAKILASTSATRQKNKEETHQHYASVISENNLSLLNDISDHFLKLQCNVCGEVFSRTRQIFHASKLDMSKGYCPCCFPKKEFTKSKGELEILLLVRDILPDLVVISGDRAAISPLELDVFIPDRNIAIEYCGLYWHSELNGKDQKYHSEKMRLCNEKGIRLITIFEDEWTNNRDIVESRIRNTLGCVKDTIFARKCIVKEISSTEANIFLNATHIQGSGRSNVRLGLYYNGELVSVMTFSSSSPSRKIVGWEINRFSSKLNSNIVGGASKLFSYFIKTFNPSEVISFADMRWSTTKSSVYSKLGMSLSHISSPNYWYITSTGRVHRFAMRKNSNDDQTLTEWKNRVAQGYDRIWDCGHAKWIWTQKETAN